MAGSHPIPAPQQSVIPPRKCSVPAEKPYFITTRNPHGSHLCSLTSGPLCLGHSTPPTASDQLRVIFRVSPKRPLPWRPSLTSKFVLCRIYVKPLPVSTYHTTRQVPCWPAPDRGQREDSTRLYREHCDIPSDTVNIPVIFLETLLLNEWTSENVQGTCTSQVHWETVSQSNLTETKRSELTEWG